MQDYQTFHKPLVPEGKKIDNYWKSKGYIVANQQYLQQLLWKRYIH